MEIKPFIMALLFLGLVYFLFNPPTGGGDKHGKHDKHGDKGKKH